MLGVESVQFSLQGRKVKLQHFLPRTLFGPLHVGGKQRTVFFTSGQEYLSYIIFSLVLYLARILLGVKNVQYSLHQGIGKLIYSISLSYSIRQAGFFYIRVGKLSYSILHLATRYDARSRKVTLERAFFFLSV